MWNWPETEHYTRAAEKLCITQPSLSHAIAQLESELGVPLFEKSGRGTKLTHFGQQFLSCALDTLATLDQGVEELQRVGRGEGIIRLGLLRTLGVKFMPEPGGTVSGRQSREGHPLHLPHRRHEPPSPGPRRPAV